MSADEVRVGDLVRRTPTGAVFVVVEVGAAKRQAASGYWYRPVVLASRHSGVRVREFTSSLYRAGVVQGREENA